MKETVCADWEERLSLYVDGLLNPFDENAVEAHLARCEACRKTVELWKAVGATIRRTPNYLPPPDLRERILNNTTHRKRLAYRFRPAWWQWAPALGLGLLAAWLTLPQPPQTSQATETLRLSPTQSVTATVEPTHRESASEPIAVPQMVVVVESNPAFRVVSAQPRWVASARLSTVSPITAETSTPPSVPQFTATPSQSSTPIVTAIADAESSEPVVLPAPTVSVMNSAPSVSGATPNPSSASTTALAEWGKQFNEQIRRDRRLRLNSDRHNQNPSDRFVVPIVSINLR